MRTILTTLLLFLVATASGQIKATYQLTNAGDNQSIKFKKNGSYKLEIREGTYGISSKGTYKISGDTIILDDEENTPYPKNLTVLLENGVVKMPEGIERLILYQIKSREWLIKDEEAIVNLYKPGISLSKEY